MSDIKFFLSWAHADHALKEDLVSRLTPHLKSVKNTISLGGRTLSLFPVKSGRRRSTRGSRRTTT